MADHVYCKVPELKLLTKRGGKRSSTTVLMGAWLSVVEQVDAKGWLKVRAFGKEGYVRQADTTEDDDYLKLFFVDVGQGDGCLIEAPGKRLLVDGGQYARNLKSYLTKWKYKWLIKAGHRVRFDAVIVSHFDADHFAGLTSIIKDNNFEFGTIYHNGIARFHRTKSQRAPKYDKKVGQTDAYGQPPGTSATILKTSFNTVDDAKKLLTEGGLMSGFKKFLEAVVQADNEGSLGSLKRITYRDGHLPGFTNPNKLVIDVLGPVTVNPTGRVTYAWFDDDSHTINGHSLLLRLTYGDRTFLLGGDLNIPSEEYLLNEWGPGVFRVDVAKACHHGSSEFTIPFLEAVKPRATVFSSGDNENYAHPRADALGCSGRYTRGARPLVFSTELARSHKSSDDIHFGLINCRTDGEKIVLAQMFEKAKRGDVWDSYVIP
jgi:beta-lactamase superfamily II metal-dependent hydrolase